MVRFTRPHVASPDDPKIVELTMSLGQALEVSKLSVERVQWTQWIPAGRTALPIPSDWCFFKHRKSIDMPEAMLGKLTLEEWRPIIASSILFEKKLRRPADRKWWIYLILPLFLLVVVPIAPIAILGPSPIFYLVSFSCIFLFFPIAILGNRRVRPYLKRGRLEADTRSSILTGKDSFVDVLRKVDRLRQENAEHWKAESRTIRTLALPSIAERISNLQEVMPGKEAAA